MQTNQSKNVTQDEEKVAQYRKAAAQNDAVAQFNLALCYEEGTGVTKDEKEAVKWYRKAAEQNHAGAQFNLALCYRDGIGVTKDEKEMVRWFRKAAEQNDAVAQFKLGWFYGNGIGVTKDEKEMVRWFRKAAEQNDADAQYNLAFCYENSMGVAKDEREAMALYRKAAERNQVEAQYVLGSRYENGTGVTKDEREAVKWYRKAAEQNDAGAECKLGWCYENGTGVTKDEREAVKWYRKAAEQNDAEAQCRLGWCYENGTGVTKDEREAVRWYRKAVDQNYANAQNCLGWAYENGFGVEQNYSEAAKWYLAAAEQGEICAQCHLVGCYFVGQGVIKNKSTAIEWYKKASVREEYAEVIKALEKLGSEGNRIARERLQLLINLQKTDIDQHVQEMSETKLSVNFSPTSPKLPQSPQIIVAEEKSNKKSEKSSEIAVSYMIKFDELELGKKLGQGGFGVVYQANWRFDEVAVKQLLSDQLSEDTIAEFKTEAQTMARLRYRNIVQFYGYCESPKYCLVMEYMPKGSLYTVLHSKENLTWDMRIKIITDITCGLAFLHHENILHRDIKSLNVLLNNQLDAKLTDFGLSKVKHETKTTTKTSSSVGTVQWMAPELFKRGGKYNQKSDVYSLGITLWEIAARRRPFDDAENLDVIPSWVKDGERPGEVKEEDTDLKIKDCPKKIASLIRFCWQGNPDKRPEAANIVKYLKSQSEDFATFDPQAINSNTAQTEVKVSSNNSAETNSRSLSSSAPQYRSNLVSEFSNLSLRK